MIRYGLGILAAAGVCAAFGAVACGDEIKETPATGGTGGTTGSGGSGGTTGTGATGAGATSGSGGGGGGGSVTLPTTCDGECCPTADACYGSVGKAAGFSGPECLALQDNTGKDFIQMRQTWIRATTPVGNTQDIVYKVLSGRTSLPWADCKMSGVLGSGGYIQLINFYLGGDDITKHWSSVGYSTFVKEADLQQTLTDGFCNGAEQYAGEAAYRLPAAQMSPSADYPPGMPKPMALGDGGGPWDVKPVRAKRLADDFDLSNETTRKDLIAKLAADGEYGQQGFNGVFYYKDGVSHGFSPLSWTIVYASDGASHISIPIREVETRSRYNDKDHPNCVGRFRGEALDPAANCVAATADDPAWGSGDCGGTECAPGDGPATTDGYFLITELDQIYSPDLQNTLCVTYPLQSQMETEGFYNSTDKNCRSAKWDPTKADGSGLPKGDWCAATNKPATATCHDAWKSHSVHTYSASKIKVPADPTGPTVTCPFQ